MRPLPAEGTDVNCRCRDDAVGWISGDTAAPATPPPTTGGLPCPPSPPLSALRPERKSEPPGAGSGRRIPTFPSKHASSLPPGGGRYDGSKGSSSTAGGVTDASSDDGEAEKEDTPETEDADTCDGLPPATGICQAVSTFAIKTHTKQKGSEDCFRRSSHVPVACLDGLKSRAPPHVQKKPRSECVGCVESNCATRPATREGGEGPPITDAPLVPALPLTQKKVHEKGGRLSSLAPGVQICKHTSPLRDAGGEEGGGHRRRRGRPNGGANRLLFLMC